MQKQFTFLYVFIFRINLLKVFFSIILFPFLQFTINAQWDWQSGLPPKQRISKIITIDSSIVFEVGEKGLIIKSTNRGNTWFAQSSNSELFLHDVSFVDSNFGFAVGDSGIILRTTNGGNNWIKEKVNGNSALRTIFILDHKNLWACGDNGTIINSTNSGESWEFKNSGMSGAIVGAHFSNINEGCAINYNGFFLYTSDGGDNWISTPSGGFITAIDFINDSIGYASGYRWDKMYYSCIIWKTTDGGKTWDTGTLLQLDTIIKEIYFISNETGFAVGYGLAAGLEFSCIYKTTNAGINWQQVFIGPATLEMNSITFNNINEGIAVDSKGRLYYSINSGDNWELLSSDKFSGCLFSSCFTDHNYGWAVGSTLIGPSDGVALKTTNGGITWSENIKIAQSQLLKVFFANRLLGWIGGYAGTFYRTSNGGETWNSLNLDSSGSIWDIIFINENVGWIIHGLTLKKTTNKGESWIIQREFEGYHVGNIFFIDENNGWIPYDIGKILKTTNGGIEWTAITTNSGYVMNSIFMIDKFKGWVVTNEPGKLLITENGGINWELKDLGYDLFKSVFFLDSLKGFLAGSDGLILKTSDGGITWEKYITNIANSLNCINFVDQQTGWIVGNGGTILKTKNGGISFANGNIEQPLNFILFQNYPNPFNPSTTIRYNIPQSSYVTLKIYDILGREVKTLINEEKSVGNYEIKFDGSNLASGIYFYRLTAGDFSETKKFMLQK